MARRLLRGLALLSGTLLFVGGVYFLFSQSQEVAGSQPELHPTTLLLDPASPVDQGRIVTVVAKLENSGESAAAEFKVEFFLRPRPKGGTVPSWISFSTTQLRGLSPQEQEIQVQGIFDTSSPSLIPAPDIYEIRVVVDSNDQIPESDETNNELITSLLVQPSLLGKPDLRPVALAFTPPSPVFLTSPDQTVLVTATITNSGDRDASPFRVSFSYCRLQEGQSSCPSEFVEFDRARPNAFAGGLPKGGTKDDGARLLISSLDPAIYLIKATVDPPDPDNPAGQIKEQDEANNELIAVLSIQGPELHPVGLLFNPPLPRAGDTVKVMATIENSGQGTARNVEVAFLVNGAPFDRQTLTLEENQSATVEGTLKTAELLLDVGIHLIRIVVDPNNQISERDETNNEIRTALTLQTPTPRRAELHPKGLIVNPRSPIELESNRELGVLSEIVNTGAIAARTFEITFFYRLMGSVRWIPIACTTSCTVAELAPGTGIQAAGTLPLGDLAPGNYQVRVVVDPDGRVPELDDFNNELVSAFTLLRPRKPDLIIDPASVRIQPSLEVRRGALVSISASVVNIGERAAGSFTVEYSLRRLDEEIFTVFARRSVSGLLISEQALLTVGLDTTALRPGFYQIQIVADSEQIVNELSEGNNVFTTGLDPQAALFVRGPDLVPAGLRFVDPALAASPRVTRGAKVELLAEITNIGLEAAGAFEVAFCRQRVGETSCVPFGERTSFPGLGTGVVLQAKAVLDTTNLEPGSYLVQVVIDPVEQGRLAGRVEEENELNNTAALPLEITGEARTTGVDLTVASLVLAPPQAIAGDIVEVRAEVANIGTQDAGPFRVVFFWKRVGTDKPVNFAGFNLPGLAKGERKTLTAQLDTSFLWIGEFEIIVVADFNEDIPESNEENNKRSVRLRVD